MMAGVLPHSRRLLVPVLLVCCLGLIVASRVALGDGSAFSEVDQWTVVVAIVLAVIALLVPAIVRGRLEGTASTLPWASLFFVLALMVGILTRAIAGPVPVYLAPLSALVVGVSVLSLATWLWFLPLRPVYGLQRLKSDPAALDAAVERVLRRLEAWNPRGSYSAKRQAQVAILAASVLTDMRRWKDASRALGSAAIDRIDPYRRSLVQASRAVALIYQGQRRAAWDAMKDADRYAAGNPALQKSLAINAELIASLDGPPEPVLRRLEEIGRPAQAVYQRGWLLARANALAASGDHEAARGALKELSLIAADGLERAVDLNGPASELARQLRG